jgi:hypothetical protein
MKNILLKISGIVASILTLFNSKEEPVMREFDNGRKEWHLNDKLHRTDGPAIEYPDGDKEWYVNGKRHRLDGPAVEWAEVFGKHWYVNGKRHRLDGPASVYPDPDGHETWYVNGTEVTEDLHLFDSEEGRAFLLLKYGQP